MLEDEFTMGLAGKIFKEKVQLVSIEEGTRRLDCGEKMYNEGEVLKIIV